MLLIPDKICVFSMLFFLISCVESSCKIRYYPKRDVNDVDELRIKSGNGPLIYTYNSHISEFRYPLVDRDMHCIFNSSNDITGPDSRIHLACPGHFLEVHKHETNKLLNTTYVMESTGPSQFNIYGYGIFNFDEKHYIKCNDIPVSKMKLSHRKGDADYFSIGFKLNVLDFLTSYRIMKNDNLHFWGHVTVVSVIEKKPKFKGSYEYNEGIIYQKKFVNFTKIYTKEYQINRFKELIQDKKLVEKYFSDDNSLVKGQLIYTDDLFYKAQQISTFYYENTFPIWHSINEGNWKLIGNIIRKLADESVTDMEVFTIPMDNLRIIESPKLYLGNSSYPVNIPKMLIKVVFSSTNKNRGLVFHTINDPYISIQDMLEIMLDPVKGFCARLFDCSDDYPDFLVPERGLTYCCALEDSKARRLVNVL